MQFSKGPVAQVQAWLLATTLACLAGAASAQEVPRYVPTRDVAVTYAVHSDQPGVPPSVLVRISSAGRMRIDAGESGYVLYDASTNKARWVIPQATMFVDLPVRGSLVGQFAPQSGAQFTRAGGQTVAGLRCTDWRVTSPRGRGNACVTTDGVILRGDGTDTKGHGGTIEATNVAYAEQPASLFETPPGFQHMSLPKGLSLPPQMVR